LGSTFDYRIVGSNSYASIIAAGGNICAGSYILVCNMPDLS